MLQVTANNENKVTNIGDSDHNLIALARGRDQQAFKKLYERHLPVVYGLCLRLTGSAQQAEEATQEVFIRLWRKLDSFRGDSSFSTWLHRLTTNTTISYLRRQKSWLQRFSDREDEQELADKLEYSPPADLSPLLAALPRLPERARLVFVLHAIEGYRQEQVAEVMGTSVGTVKAQYHKASAQIREWLAESTGAAE